MYDEIFGGNVENENDNKTEIKNETAEAAAAPSDDTVYDSASDTNSYEYSYNNTVADKNENDGSYHHSYINPDTYNPNRNTYASGNYEKPSGEYSNTQYAGYSNSYPNNPYSQSYRTQNPQNSYQNGSYQYQYGTSRYGQNTYSKNNVKKSKAKIGAGTVAVLLIVTIILSGAFGFFGSLLYNKLTKKDSTTTDGQVVVHKINADTETNGAALVDKTTAEITEEVADSVVEITTEVMTTNSFYGQMVQTGAGSGVIISDDGYIVTNNHVIEGASSIRVTLRNGDQYDAKLIGRDSEEDLALIKIEAEGLTEVVFGDSDTLKVGDKAVAIGNPLGTLGGTVTDGIISALDRKVQIDGTTMTLLQTDTAINPGNSGGGLFNGQGELIGIVSAKSAGESVDNLGFAIPVNKVLDILSDLKEYGYVTGRPTLGVSLIDISNKMYSMYYFGSMNTGVFVNSVTGNTNLKTGDRIISVNGTEVESSSQVEEIISELKVGDEVELQIERSNQTGKITVTLEESKPDAASDSNNNSDNYYFNPFG